MKVRQQLGRNNPADEIEAWERECVMIMTRLEVFIVPAASPAASLLSQMVDKCKVKVHPKGGAI